MRADVVDTRIVGSISKLEIIVNFSKLPITVTRKQFIKQIIFMKYNGGRRDEQISTTILWIEKGLG